MPNDPIKADRCPSCHNICGWAHLGYCALAPKPINLPDDFGSMIEQKEVPPMAQVAKFFSGLMQPTALCMKRDPETGYACQLEAGHQGRHKAEPLSPEGAIEPDFDKWLDTQCAHGDEDYPSPEAIGLAIAAWTAALAAKDEEIAKLRHQKSLFAHTISNLSGKLAKANWELNSLRGEREWIAIREGCEMPRDFEDVFVMSGGKQIIAWRKSDDPNWYEAFSDSNEPLGENVTHWQSFPAPPKEGTR